MAEYFRARNLPVPKELEKSFLTDWRRLGGIAAVLLVLTALAVLDARMLLATGMGYLFTGDTGATFTGRFSLLERQVLSTLLVAAYSTGVSFLLWSLLKRLPSWLRPARVGSAALLPRPLPAS